MLKYLLITAFLLCWSPVLALMPGDTVSDLAFDEITLTGESTADTIPRSLHTILNDGRTVIIYFFTITFS